MVAPITLPLYKRTDSFSLNKLLFRLSFALFIPRSVIAHVELRVAALWVAKIRVTASDCVRLAPRNLLISAPDIKVTLLVTLLYTFRTVAGLGLGSAEFLKSSTYSVKSEKVSAFVRTWRVLKRQVKQTDLRCGAIEYRESVL